MNAGGYGENVRTFYLEITNPVSEGVADLSAYKTIKARENAKKIRNMLKKRNGIHLDEFLNIWNEA